MGFSLFLCRAEVGIGRMVRWCWVNFQCGASSNFDYSRARAYCACSRCGWGYLDIFTLVYHFSFLSPSLWETARYRLKYCLKGHLSPKQATNRAEWLELSLIWTIIWNKCSKKFEACSDSRRAVQLLAKVCARSTG